MRDVGLHDCFELYDHMIIARRLSRLVLAKLVSSAFNWTRQHSARGLLVCIIYIHCFFRV